MNHNRKRLPDGTQAKTEDLRESVAAWANEIGSKCRAHGMPAGVIVIVVPLEDPKPQYAYTVTPQGAQKLLRHVGDDIAAKGGGVAIAPASALPKA